MSNVTELVPGDRVKTLKWLLIRHPVIYMGGGYFAEKTKSGERRLRHFSSFDDQQFVVEHRPSPQEARRVVARVLARLGPEDYDLFNANCQHFVNEIYTGQPRSEQVEGLKALAAFSGFLIILGALAAG